MITLDASYARCRELNKAYGTTYYAATFVLPFTAWAFDADRPTIVLAVAIFVFVVWTHRGNIGRLWRRREHRF